MATESFSLMEVLTKEEKEAQLAKKMEEIRRKNKEREERHKEILADKMHAEEQKAAISAGASEHNRHSKDTRFPVRANESHISDEATGRDDNWANTNYREEWPEREESDEPQYWQQSRQRGGKDSAFGQWTRGGGGPHGLSSRQPQANERSGQANERSPDWRGRRGGNNYNTRGGRRAVRPGDGSVYADEDNSVSADSALPTSSDLLSPTITKPGPTNDRPGAHTATSKTAAKADNVLGTTTAAAAATYTHVTDAPAGHGSGRGRGRGIVPTRDQVKQDPLHREVERPAAPGGLQSPTRQQLQHPSAGPPRHSPPAEKTPTPSISTQHQQEPSKKNANHQVYESGQSDVVADRHPSRQLSEHAGQQEQQPPHHQQSYEETRKRNAAAYEESLRSNPGFSSGRFLADRLRDVQTDYSKTNEENRQFRQQQSSAENPVASPVRHQRNFCGATADLEHVKNKVKEVAHMKQDAYRGRPSAQHGLELHMTGHERQQYAAWREDRERIDQARLDRSRRAGDGGWRRQWDCEKDYPPSKDDNTAALHEERSTALPRSANTRRIGSGRALAGGCLDERRSPDHGGDRTAHAKGQRNVRVEEAAAVSDSENAKQSGQGRQRRNRKRRENAHAEKESIESERATNATVHGGAGDAGMLVDKSERLSHVGDGDTSQRVQKGTVRQSLPGDPLATDGHRYALPPQDSASTRVSDDNLKVHATANDTHGATRIDRQPEQQASKDDAGSTLADAAAADGHDDEWEDVDDFEDDEEYNSEEGGDDGNSGRHVVDWAAEVENEYGSS